MNCKICDTNLNPTFKGKILNKYTVDYYHCPNCDFIQTENPYWLDEAYEQSINSSDTGYMYRNLLYSQKLTILLYYLFGTKGKFLDYAGGYGVFVRLMRDIGFDFYWADKYTTNLLAQGFEWNENGKYDAITLFEVFEHFVDPMSEIENLFSLTDTILFSTEMHPSPVPNPEDWWYFGLEHGQHIALYSEKTLSQIAKHFGCNYYRIGGLHILSKLNIPKKFLTYTRFSRFCYNKWISRKLESKTWTDHLYIVENQSSELLADD